MERALLSFLLAWTGLAVEISVSLLNQCANPTKLTWPEDFCASWTDNNNKIKSAYVHCDAGLVSSSSWTLTLHVGNSDCTAPTGGGSKFVFKGQNADDCGLDISKPLIDLFSFKVDCGAKNGQDLFASAGKTQVSINTLYPWDIKFSTANSIGSGDQGKYVRWRYTEFAEVSSDGDVVPNDMNGQEVTQFHSVPVNNVWFTAVAAIGSWAQDSSPYFASRIVAGELKQNPDGSHKIKALLASYLAKQDFDVAGFKAAVGAGGVETQVCFHAAKTDGSGGCQPFQMKEGMLKSSVGFYNLRYKNAEGMLKSSVGFYNLRYKNAVNNSWRISAELLPVGLTSPLVYFNGNKALTGSFNGEAAIPGVMTLCSALLKLPFKNTSRAITNAPL
eukprot:g79950.t1